MRLHSRNIPGGQGPVMALPITDSLNTVGSDVTWLKRLRWMMRMSGSEDSVSFLVVSLCCRSHAVQYHVLSSSSYTSHHYHIILSYYVTSYQVTRHYALFTNKLVNIFTSCNFMSRIFLTVIVSAPKEDLNWCGFHQTVVEELCFFRRCKDVAEFRMNGITPQRDIFLQVPHFGTWSPYFLLLPARQQQDDVITYCCSLPMQITTHATTPYILQPRSSRR